MSDTRIAIGSTFQLSVADTRSSADGYTSEHFVSGQGLSVNMNAVYDSGRWTTRWTAAPTFDPGRYSYEIWLTLRNEDNEVVLNELLEEGSFEMYEPSSITDEAQNQSFLEKVLGAAEKALLELADSGHSSLSVGGQSFTFESRDDLLNFRNRVSVQLNRSRRPRFRGITFIP